MFHRLAFRVAPIIAVSCLTAPQLSAQSDSSLSYSKKREFYLPIKIDRNDPIKELLLYAQTNSGNWNYLSSARPTETAFKFSTTSDGAYGFVIQAVYTNGSKEPSKDQFQAQMKVIVDTVPPRISVTPRTGTDEGTAGVEWSIIDDNLNLSSIRLEYQWPGKMSSFEPMQKNDRFGAKGSFYWELKGEERIRIRIRARDYAGNESFSDPVTTFVGVDANVRGGGGNPGPQRPGLGGGIAPGGPTSLVPQPGVNDVRDPRNTRGDIVYVNTRELTLSSVAEAGPSGLTDIKLYQATDKSGYTRVEKPDYKKTQSAGSSKGSGIDRMTSWDITIPHKVEADGIYRFVIVAATRAGTSQKEPTSKDDPAMVTVVVDTEKPKVSIPHPPRAIRNGNNGVFVDIVWTATDTNMASAPISLYFSENGADNKWQEIATGLDNNGAYRWVLPEGSPHSFHVRVVAKDRAGNEGDTKTTEPVNADLVPPKVDFTDVKPKIGVAGVIPAKER